MTVGVQLFVSRISVWIIRDKSLFIQAWTMVQSIEMLDVAEATAKILPPKSVDLLRPSQVSS